MKTINKLIITVIIIMVAHCNLHAQDNATAYNRVRHIFRGSDTVQVADVHGSISDNKVFLNWTVERNQDADQFEIERSEDGKNYVMAALVFGTGKPGADKYWFFEKKRKQKTYYRIKLIHTDGSISYSPVSITNKQLTAAD
jgi:hypothetical protein